MIGPNDPDEPATEVDVERAIERQNETLPGSVQDASEQAFEAEVGEHARDGE